MQRLLPLVSRSVPRESLKLMSIAARRLFPLILATLRKLQPNVVGEAVRRPPPSGPSKNVEGAPDNPSSSAVQLLSIARGGRRGTCAWAGGAQGAAC